MTKTERCKTCKAEVEITEDHQIYGDGPWCACCSTVYCDECWEKNGCCGMKAVVTG